MSQQGHRRRSKRAVGWKQRQDWHTKAVRQEHGSTVIDRAMGRTWTTPHGELLRTAQARTTATQRFYVWRQPNGPWRIGSYIVR